MLLSQKNMYSVREKHKKAKDRIEQDICSAVEDYLKESEQKHYLEKSNDYKLNKKNKYKKTCIKNISIVPILEDDNFISTIKKYMKSENLFKNEGKILNDDEIFVNRYKSFSEKSPVNESNKDISQNTEKVEILEDGSICIKNTTGLVSPSLGEKLVEIKNMNIEDSNKEIEQDILINSKLLISNNIRSLEEYEDKEYMTINDNNLNRKKNNILEINDLECNSNSKINTTLPDILKDNNIGKNYFQGVYFSTSKKNKINSKRNSYINSNQKKINTNVKKKKLIRNQYNNTFNLKEKDIKKKERNFIKEIKINNENELNYKRILFGDNYIEDDDDINNQWKYLSNKYIKKYNKELLSNNIQIIVQNLKIQNILNIKNKSKKTAQNNSNIIKCEDNYLNNNEQNLSIKEENIKTKENIDNSIKSSFDDISNNNNSVCSNKPTNISQILNPPILNYNNNYENIFNEIDNISEEIIKDESYNKVKKYQGDIESINEEMNESYEEPESKEDKIENKILHSSNKKRNEKIIKIKDPKIDKFKINLDLNKINEDMSLINKMYKEKNVFELKIKDIDSLSYSPISCASNRIRYQLNNKNNNRNSKCSSDIIIGSADISISKEKEIELSDDEKELNRNLLSKYLTYKIESNYDGGGIKLLFFFNNSFNAPKYLININSYKKIIKMIFYKKRKPISKYYYESLIKILINHLSKIKKEYSLIKKNRNIINEKEKEEIKNVCIEIDKKINILDNNIKELKDAYINGIIKKQVIKDKNEKKKFIKKLNIQGKRNKLKIIYNEIIKILNDKINETEIKNNYYKGMNELLTKYEKINEKDINEGKIKYIYNENKENIEHKRKNKINEKKIFIILLPIMFVINYFMNNLKGI